MDETPEQITDRLFAEYAAENVVPFNGKRKRETRDAEEDSPGFQMKAAGLYFTGGDGKAVLIAGPFEVLGRARDPSGDEWARWVRFYDDDKREHRIAIKDSDLHGDPGALAATLARQGLWISPRHRRHLVDYLNEVEVDARVTIVTRTGWHTIGERPVFVLPSDSFGKPEKETVVLNATGSSPYSSRGSLAEWQNTVGKLTSGHRLGVLAVSTAFAGPLLNLADQDGGGIHYRGPSSMGKTSHARAAASVYGPPTFVRTWRATANALEAIAEQHSDTFLPLDELNAGTGKEVYAAAYQLSAGVGKGRAHRDGSARKPKEWRVMFLSTGEIGLAAKLAEDHHGPRARAGQEVRLLDIEADVGKGYGAFDSPGPDNNAASVADAITSAAAKAYGTAGPAFIKEITEFGTEKTTKLVSEMVESFCKRAAAFGTDGQVQRASRRLALIAAAGELAIKFGIVPWVKGSATRAAQLALQRWLAGRGGNEAAEVIAAISAVRLFIEKHGDSRFQNITQNSPDDIVPLTTTPIVNRAGYRKGRGEDQIWLILPEVWKSEVCIGLDPTLVARVLFERGMIERGDKQFAKVHWVDGRSVRCFTVTARILSAADDETTSKTSNGSNTGLSEATPTGKNHSNIKDLTGLTGLTGQKHNERGNNDEQSNPFEQDDLEIPDFLDRRPKTLLTDDDAAFIESGGFK